VVQRHLDDRRGERDVIVELGGEPGQRGYRLQPAQVAVEVVLPDGDVRDPVALRGVDLAQQRVEVLARGDASAHVAKDHTDPHMLPCSTELE
jgi:hypothetical protein